MQRSASGLGAIAYLILGLTLPAAAQMREAPPGTSLRFRAHTLKVSPNECLAVTDINRDGHPDIVAGRFWFAGPDFVPRPLRELNEFGKDYLNNNGDHIIDVNGNGWPDVVSGSFTEPHIYWYENPGDGNEHLAWGKLWQRHLLADTGETTNEITMLHDLDGDGQPELLVNSWRADRPMIVWQFATDDNGKPTLRQRTLTHPDAMDDKTNGHGIGVGDINGDGRDDIVFAHGWYEQPPEGLNAPWTKHADFHLPSASCPILIVDLDGDGRNDMIWGNGHDYGLYWMQQLEPAADGTTRWQQHIIDESWSQAHTLHLADLTGDGRLELITGKRIRGHSGRDPGAQEPPCLFYYTWDEQEQRFTRHLINVGRVGTGLQIRTADLNASGRLDIIVSGKSGTFVLFNEGQ